MKILFLDQSGKLGGAELSLMDIAKPYRDRCLVGLFADGTFRESLEQKQIPVRVLYNQTIQARKEHGFIKNLGSVSQLAPLINRVARLSRDYDLIYANTQKALVVGAIASFLSQRPLVYHLRDILSADHFSITNRRIAITLANLFAKLVISNSKATQSAFLAAGGRADIAHVVYNGFVPESYQNPGESALQLKQQLGLTDRFVVGHFSRLSPWKGQHILIEALSHCPEDVTALLVGDALFGEQDYVDRLHQQVKTLGLEKRVYFLGFRHDVVTIMHNCDLIAHTSTAPEPFGRVIIEAMLCGKPAIAAQAGGAVELLEHAKTGWLVPPGNPEKLAEVIKQCRAHPEISQQVARQGQEHASQHFNLTTTNQQIAQLLQQLVSA